MVDKTSKQGRRYTIDGRRLVCGGGPLFQPGPADPRGEIILWDAGTAP